MLTRENTITELKDSTIQEYSGITFMELAFVKKINMKRLNKIQLLSHLKNFDLIIFCVNHLKFKKIKFQKLLSNGKTFLFDLNNVLTINQINKIKKNNINFYSFGQEVTKYSVI